jgi:hypothetical protein
MDTMPIPEGRVAQRLDEMERELEKRSYSNAEIGALAAELLEIIATAKENPNADQKD